MRALLVISSLLLVASIPGAFAQNLDQSNKLRIAEAFEQAGDYEKALGIYKQLHEEDPANFVYFDAVRRVCMLVKDYPQAERLIRDRLRTDSSNTVLLCQLGDAYFKGGTPDSADLAWNRALATAPGNPNTYRVVAGYMVNNRLFDRAADVFRKGNDLPNSKGIFTVDIARLYFLNMKYAESVSELLTLLEHEHQSYTVEFIESQLGGFSSSKEALAQFTSKMKEEVGRQPDNKDYREILAFLYMEQKDYPAAYDNYKWLDEHSADRGSELLTFADRAYNDEAYDVAASAYDEVTGLAKNRSVVARALMGYGNSLREMGEKEYSDESRPCSTGDTLRDLNASLAVYEKIISGFPDSQYLAQAFLDAAELKMIYFSDFAGAGRLLAEFDSRFPANQIGSKLMKVRLLILEGKFEEALAAATDAMKNPIGADQHDRLAYEAALTLFYMGKYDSSSTYLRTITSNPTSDAANEAIHLQNLISDNSCCKDALNEYASVRAMEDSGRLPEAAALCEEILKKYPEAPLADNARFDLASDYCKMGRIDDALKHYSELARDSTGLFADRAQFNIGRIYQVTLRQKEKAISIFENFLMRFPNSIYQDKVRAIITTLMNAKS